MHVTVILHPYIRGHVFRIVAELERLVSSFMGRHNPTVMYCWVTCQRFVEPDRAFGTAEISQLQKVTGRFGRKIFSVEFQLFSGAEIGIVSEIGKVGVY